jgi:hypothetical protein
LPGTANETFRRIDADRPNALELQNAAESPLAAAHIQCGTKALTADSDEVARV